MVNAGNIDTVIHDKSESSHYFLKFETKLNKILNLKFETNNTVGPNSINKQEIIHKLNNFLK